ncbi:hypothetical protein RWH43_06045 [Microbacterium sp. KSW2-21]|uniref:YtxH domain-containing protein n=1 Tax=Microbacterium algihabitans TaxID=3075992 RepID=A0ABU3RTV1_9MICO|nr:hypothetical protein [Microbacterium sp. KSW2-21]MDU0326317.1 hypothetical protein [Microbacterium sp. KSW2-21]
MKVITGAAVVGGGVAVLLYRSPELRRVVSDIGRDAEVRASITASCDVIRKKWISFGGPSALTNALLGAP